MRHGRHSLTGMALAAGMLAVSATSQADGLDSGGEPYERCALCHGLFGNTPRQRFPRLAGQHPEYLEHQIRNFMAGSRVNDGGQMQSVVTEIQEEDIEGIVAWFSSQVAPDPYEQQDAVGEGLFKAAGCGSCHDAASAVPSVPILYAQHPQYLAKQLGDFRDARRDAGVSAAAKAALSHWSDDALMSVSVYLASVSRR